MKKIFLLLLVVFLAFNVAAKNSLPTKKEILKNIKAPTFKKVDYSILDFGAVGDSTTDCRQAINNAISKCSNNGGGRVVVPAGKYYSAGSIILKSNVNLYLAERSVIIFSSKPEDFLPAVLTIWEGTELFNYSPLVYAYHVSNIAITGKGALDGRASQSWGKTNKQGSKMQSDLRQMGIDQVPVFKRNFGESSVLPPSMIQPFGCRNILIEGITIYDSPYWVIHPVYCDNVTVRAVEINSYNFNNDGCDPEYTTNVLIENCVFNVGDDAIALKAGRDNDAWRVGQPTRNILIRNCKFNSKCNGLCIGSEMSAGVENVYMENVKISKCLSGIYFKSNLDRGGYIKNVYVKNIDIDTVRTAFIRFETSYFGGRGGFHPTLFQNFLIENVTGKFSRECGFYAVGIENYALKDITLNNIKLSNTPEPYFLKFVDNIEFNNVTINEELMQKFPQETKSVKLKSY